MDGRTSNAAEAGRRLEWPPRNSASHASPTSWESAAASDRTSTIAEPGARNHRASTKPRRLDSSRWASVALWAGAIATTAAIAATTSRFNDRARDATGAQAPALTVSQVAAAVEPPASPVADRPAAPSTGRLTIGGPAGARVWVDGSSRGTAPLTIANLPTGRHEIKVQTKSGVATERVVVSAGTEMNLVVSTPASSPVAPRTTSAQPAPADVSAAPVPGSVVVSLPFDVQIYEDERFAGTGRSELTLSPGLHRLELVNKSLNYRAVESVQVEAGKSATIPASVPNGTVSFNALPWAEVFVDGRKLGDTPLGQVSIAIGAHDVVFRHPQYGEQSRTLVVGAGTPVRISVDLRK